MQWPAASSAAREISPCFFVIRPCNLLHMNHSQPVRPSCPRIAGRYTLEEPSSTDSQAQQEPHKTRFKGCQKAASNSQPFKVLTSPPKQSSPKQWATIHERSRESRQSSLNLWATGHPGSSPLSMAQPGTCGTAQVRISEVFCHGRYSRALDDLIKWRLGHLLERSKWD